jgi:hypothetical protein
VSHALPRRSRDQVVGRLTLLVCVAWGANHVCLYEPRMQLWVFLHVGGHDLCMEVQVGLESVATPLPFDLDRCEV